MNFIQKIPRTRKSKESSNDVVMAPNPHCSEFEVNNWELSELIISKLLPVVGIHPFPLNELLLMAGSVARFQPQLIFEWGTHVGKSALVFHLASEALGVNPTIHSIDLPDDVEHGEHPHQERGKLVRNIDRVKLHQGDGVITSLDIIKSSGKSFKNGYSVLFFIDGDHSYESVKRELSLIMKKAPQASILLHDTFYQSRESRYNVGPFQAITDCLGESRKKYKRVDTATGLPCMTLLYPE